MKKTYDAPTVGFIVLGAGGNMGSLALQKIDPLREELKKRGVTLSPIVAVENDRTKWPNINKVIANQSAPNIQRYEDITDCIPFLENHFKTSQAPMAVYDATPTPIHFDHFALLQKTFKDRPLVYLGEKPMITEEKQLQFLKNKPCLPFNCNFVETENLVFRSIRDYISSSEFEIERLGFWRVNSQAFHQLTSLEQRGLAGSAFWDKAAHDLSLSIGLLGLPSIKRVKINSCMSPLYMPPHWKCATNIAGVSNDAVTFADLSWERDGRPPVSSNYLFSWAGVTGTPHENMLVSRLSALGFSPALWLAEEPIFDERGHQKFFDQEFRIGIIEGNLNGEPTTIVCNLLHNKGNHPNIRKFAVLVNSVGEHISIYDESDQLLAIELIDPLTKVFLSAVQQSLGDSESQFRGEKATILVHEIMLAIQTQLNTTMAHRVKEYVNVNRSKSFFSFYQPCPA